MKWPEKTVSEMCLLAVDCVNKTAPTVEYPTPYKMIRTTNVKGGFIYLDHVNYVTEEVYAKWTRRSKPQYGDVILTREAPVGEVGRFTSHYDGVFLGQRLFHYRPDPKQLDWNYLAYVLQSRPVQGRLQGMGFGATVNHIRVGDAEKVSIPVPPLPVQLQIGGTLAAYDDLIENNRRRIQLLEESARLLYREWFVHLRFPGHEHVKVVDGAPEGWEVATMGDVAETVGGGTPSTKVPEYWEDGEVVWFTPTDLTGNDCLVLLDSEKKITEEGLKRSSAKRLPPKTILMTSRASIGYFGLYEGIAATNQGFISIIPNDDTSRMYLLHNLISRKDEIESLAGGTTYREINKTTFRAMRVRVPPGSLCRQFHEFCEDIFAQALNLKKQNQKLSQARDLLLPRLMNGEIAV